MSLNLLISYAFHDKTDVQLVRRRMVCGRLLIDSGAFTAYTKGYRIDLNDYAEFLTTWAGYWDHAITLDVVGNPAQTKANTHKLHQKGIRVMPVFTRGDSLTEFDAMVKDSGYVCVGGLVNMPRKNQVARIRMLQRRAADLGGDVHALGMASMSIIRLARPFSSDASTPSVGARFGNVLVFTGRELRQVNIQNHAKLRIHHDLLMAHGFPVADIVNGRRIPGGNGLQATTSAALMAFMVCDEFLKVTYPMTGVNGNGPVLYSVAINQVEALAMADVDVNVHTGRAPAIWRRYGSGHVCEKLRESA